MLSKHLGDGHTVTPWAAIVELTDRESANLIEGTRRNQVAEHSIDLVRGFRDVLNRDNAARRQSQSANCGARMQKGQIPSDQRPSGSSHASRNPAERPRGEWGLDGGEQLVSGSLVAATEAGDVGGVETHEPHSGAHYVEGGDVGEPNQPLWVFSQGANREGWQKSRQPVAASRCENGFRVRIPKGLVEFVQAAGIRAGEEPIVRADIGAKTQAVASREHTKTTPEEGPIEGTRGCDDANHVTGARWGGSEHGVRLLRPVPPMNKRCGHGLESTPSGSTFISRPRRVMGAPLWPEGPW